MYDIPNLLHTFGYSLLMTIILELPIALIFGIRKKDILLVLLVNILTNPAVVYLNLLLCGIFPRSSVYIWQIPLELSVIAVEGFCYSYFAKTASRPWLLSVVANCFSYGCGILINIIF